MLDVYTLQCAFLEKELVKHDLQIKLLQKIIDNADSIESTSHALSVLSALTCVMKYSFTLWIRKKNGRIQNCISSKILNYKEHNGNCQKEEVTHANVLHKQ